MAPIAAGFALRVPAVPFKIEKHCKSTVLLTARRRDELYASGDHALVDSSEVVDAQEHTTRPANCRPALPMLFAVSTREQNTCLASAGTNHDPSLWAAIIGQRRSVFHELELQECQRRNGWQRRSPGTTSATSSRCDIAGQITPGRQVLINRWYQGWIS